MKQITKGYCAECGKDFIENQIVHYTWYENRFFCDACKPIMDQRVTPSYLDWQQHQVISETK